MAETSSSLPAPTASRHNSSLLSVALDEIMSKIASSESQSVIPSESKINVFADRLHISKSEALAFFCLHQYIG